MRTVRRLAAILSCIIELLSLLATFTSVAHADRTSPFGGVGVFVVYRGRLAWLPGEWAARRERGWGGCCKLVQGGVKGGFRSIAIPRWWAAVTCGLVPAGIAAAVMSCGA